MPITQAWFEADGGRIFGGSVTAHGPEGYERLKAALKSEFGSPTSTSEEGTRLYQWEWRHPSGVVQLTFDAKHDSASAHAEQSN